MDNPEKTEGTIKNGQPRENRRGKSRMDNPEKTEGGNQEWTIQRNWQQWLHKTQNEGKKTQHNM